MHLHGLFIGRGKIRGEEGGVRVVRGRGTRWKCAAAASVRMRSGAEAAPKVVTEDISDGEREEAEEEERDDDDDGDDLWRPHLDA